MGPDDMTDDDIDDEIEAALDAIDDGEMDDPEPSDEKDPRRAGWRSRLSIYPRAIVRKGGVYKSETEVDTYALREKQRYSGGVRRSRCGKNDPRRRFRVRMRAAGRCNAFAAARAEEMIATAAPFDRGAAMTARSSTPREVERPGRDAIFPVRRGYRRVGPDV